MNELKTEAIIVLQKNSHKIELEKIGNVWVVCEYGKDELESNLELKDDEVENFVSEWEKEGYRISRYG